MFILVKFRSLYFFTYIHFHDLGTNVFFLSDKKKGTNVFFVIFLFLYNISIILEI